MANIMLTRRARASSITQITPPPQTETTFSFIVIPDTQQENSSDSRTPMFRGRNQWIVNNKTTLNIKHVCQNGDLVDWDDATHSHYVRADAGLDVLDAGGVRYSLCVGNHDTAAVQYGGSAAPGDTHANVRITNTFNTYFPVSRMPGIAGVYETGKIDNHYQTFTAAGLNWLVLSIEFCARPGVLAWANGIVQSHPNHNCILVTHYFMDSGGTISGSNAGYGDSSG